MIDKKTQNKTSFWNFLCDYKIVIPIIQRDYAQGNQGKEYLRHNFLSTLINALENPEKKCNLDFIYGSIKEDIFYPLDGQQRLTTLWLLHWYIVLKAGQLNDENCEILQKFSYETRISSRQFCKELCTPKNFESYNYKGKIDNYIKEQTWFYNKSLQDPTIQSMLRMLGGTSSELRDGIDLVFSDTNKTEFEKYWNILSSSEQESPISFYIFPLNNFSLSDDLYIKMNARGEQLTSFENFKADFINYIKEQSDKNKNEWMINEQNITDVITSKLDSYWTELFWENRSYKNSSEENADRRIDEIYFAFINRFFWNELFIHKENGEYSLKLGKGNNTKSQENTNQFYRYLNNSSDFNSSNENDSKIAYKTLDLYKINNKEISSKLVLKLIKVLDNYKKYLVNYKNYPNKKGDTIDDFENDILKCSWQNDFWFLPKYDYEQNKTISLITDNAGNSVLKISTLNQIQRIAFFAICHYFSSINDDIEPDFSSLKRWMRFVWNLISPKDNDGRYQIRNAEAVRNTIELITKFECTEIYESLSKKEIKNEINKDQSAMNRQLDEEIFKARRILNERYSDKQNDIEKSIIEAESLAFFNGAIRFLFTEDNRIIDWRNFDRKKENAKKYFDTKGVHEDYRKGAILIKAFLFNVGKDYFWDNIIKKGLKVFDNRPETWLANILLSTDDAAIKAVNILLLNNTEKIIIPLDDPTHTDDDLLYKNIYNSKLIDNISQKYEKSRIRFYHNHYAIYPEGSWEAYVLDGNGKNDYCCSRNKFLEEISKDESYFKFLSDKTEGNSEDGFYYGWNIRFKYKGKKYLLDADSKTLLLDSNKGKEGNNSFMGVKDEIYSNLMEFVKNNS